jgi:peptidoglycan/LPS O-acetylase OafA/YrhL
VTTLTLDCVDGLRGMAVLHVVLFHLDLNNCFSDFDRGELFDV